MNSGTSAHKTAFLEDGAITRPQFSSAQAGSIGLSWRKVLDCFFLLRIPLLAPVWTILLLGWITASTSAAPGGFIRNPSLFSGELWLMLLGFSLIVASIYVVNQIVDIEGDRINRKLFLLPHGFLSLATAWTLAALCTAGGLVIVLAAGSNALFIVFILSLVLGALYNLPPVHLKNSPLGGVAANALGHGMLTFLAGWFVAYAHEPMSGRIIVNGLIAGLSPALANAAVFLATTIPDADGDRRTGKQTFCVKFGPKKTAVASALFCAGALAASFFMQQNWWIMAATAAISLALFTLFAATAKREHAFKAFKWPVFLLSAFVAVYVPEYAVLILLTFFGSKAYYKWRFGIEYPTFKAK